MALVVVGMVLWFVESRGEGSVGIRSSALTTSLTEPNDQSAGVVPATAPAVIRLGASYVAGFFLGWGLRRFLKLTLLVAGALIVGGVLLNHFGVTDVSWPDVQEHLSKSFAWLQGQAGALRDFLTGYVPSAVAAGAGIIVGAWKG